MPKKTSKNRGKGSNPGPLEAVKEEIDNRLKYIFSPVEAPEEELPEPVIGPLEIEEIKLPEALVETVKTIAEEKAAEEGPGGPVEIKEFTRVRNRITNEEGTVIALQNGKAQVVYDTGKTAFEDLENLELI